MELLNHIAELKSLAEDISRILSHHGVNETISLSDITVTDKIVSDLVTPNARLSDAITNHLWPSIGSATVYHYTSKEAAENILNTNLFRFTNIAKRSGDGEIETFCRTHNLQGYLEQDKGGIPKYRHLIMSNTFYASFTDTALTEEREEYFWRNFAACDGVRLKLQITASNLNFRKIRYEQVRNKPIPILDDLISCARKKYGREFILKGISRLCSFYLSGDDYGIENEYRALYRTWEGFGPQPIGRGENSYIELPLGAMNESGYQLQITEVQANERPNMPTSYPFLKR